MQQSYHTRTQRPAREASIAAARRLVYKSTAAADVVVVERVCVYEDARYEK